MNAALATQPLISKYVAYLWLLTVICGCLWFFGIGFSTLSAQSASPLLPAAPSGTSANPDRSSRGRKDDGNGCDTLDSDEICASYSRFSSDQQKDESITGQQRKCRERAEKDGCRIDPRFEFSDAAVSGTKLHRDGLDAMMAAAAAGRIQRLYFYNLSRLARESVITMPMLKQLVYVYKVRIISVTEGLDSAQQGWDLMATILSLQHERYIKDLADAVFRGQEDTRSAGFSVDDHCFGYTSEAVPGSETGRRGRKAKPRKVYVVDPEEAVWVVRIFYWFVHERQSLSWITRELNRLGAPKDHRATTKEWHHQYLPDLLRRKKYIGIWPWGEKQNVRNPLTGQLRQESRPKDESEKWTRYLPDLRLIDDETFEASLQLLRENDEKCGAKRRPNGRFNGSWTGAAAGHPRHLLSGLIRCGECGAAWHVGGTNGKYLFCPSYRKGTCSCKTTLQRDRAERMMLDAIGRRVLADSVWLKAVYEELQKAWKRQQAELPDELAAVQKQLADINRKIARLVDNIESEGADPDVNRRLKDRRAEKRALDRRLEKLQRTSENRPSAPTISWLKERLQQLGETLSGKAPAAAIALRELVGGKIVVEEIREEGRQRHYLRGRFTIQSGCVIRAVTNAEESPSGGATDNQDRAEHIVIDFVDTDARNELLEKVFLMHHDEEMLCADIAKEVGCSRSRMTKLLDMAYAKHGLTKPDGRSRRSTLKKKHSQPPLYQQISEEVKLLCDTGLLLGDIADRLDVDRNTVTSAFRYWYESRDLEPPDGRTRRKNLNRKTRDEMTMTNIVRTPSPIPGSSNIA